MLDPSTLHLWCVRSPEAVDPALAGACRGVLDANELARLERFRFEGDRQRYLIGRALLRKALSRYASVGPRDWEIRAEVNGRPAIAAPASPLRFNVSHTEGLVACLIGHERDLGVDVENLGRRLPPPHTFPRYLSPAEVEGLAGLDENDRRRRFLELWTLKEAYLKACGSGLTARPGRFGFDLGGDGPIRADLAGRADDGRRWQFKLLHPATEHVLAVAARRNGDGDLAVVLHTDAESLLRG